MIFTRNKGCVEVLKPVRLFALLLVLSLTLILCSCGAAGGASSITAEPASASALTWQDQYDLGIRYLSEGNYAEAIIAFTAAIDIDPKNSTAYLGRAQATVFSG